MQGCLIYCPAFLIVNLKQFICCVKFTLATNHQEHRWCISLQLLAFYHVIIFTYFVQGFVLQDCAQAGQTVPLVHIHILPRKGDDLQKTTDMGHADDEVCRTFYVNESSFDDV